MKTSMLIVLSFLAAFAFAPANANAQGTYSANLISPRLGEVLHPGQYFRIEWTAKLPNWNGMCETELWLSLDGGSAFKPPVITPVVVPSPKGHYEWIVPKTPKNAGALKISLRLRIPLLP